MHLGLSWNGRKHDKLLHNIIWNIMRYAILLNINFARQYHVKHASTKQWKKENRITNGTPPTQHSFTQPN